VTTDPDFADLVLLGLPAGGSPDEGSAVALASALGQVIPEVRPPASGLDDLLRSVSVDEGVPTPAAEKWERTVLPGVLRRVLHVDEKNRRLTAYYELVPGGRIPAHTHTGDEDVFIVSGDLHCADGTVLRAGDLKRSTAGTFHPELWSVEGCVSLMVSPLDEEPEVAAEEGHDPV
jgi:anti-sigma factor ChrR (cupin superfamily)